MKYLLSFFKNNQEKINNIFNNLMKALGVFTLFYYSWIFQLIPVMLFKLDIDNLSDKTGVMLTAFSSLILSIILFFIFKKDIIKDFRKFKKNFWKNFDIGIKYWFFGLALMIGFNIIIVYLLSGGQSANEQTVQGMIDSLPWIMLLSAGFLAPWNEEIVFRKTIRGVLNNKWLFILISGLLFGLGHVIGQTETWIDWLYILPYGSLGCAFAAMYYDSDNIFTSIMFHIIHNLVIIIQSIL